VLVFLGIVTPLNVIIVSGIGLLTMAAGKKMADNLKVFETQDEISMEEEAAEEIRKPENVINLLQVDPIELEFGYGIIPLADSSQGGDLLDRVVMIRRQIALELGAIVPIIRLRDNIQLSPNQYVIKIKGNVIAEGEILFDHYLAMDPGYVEEQIDGIETVEPAFHLPALWITESQRERAEAVGYTVVDPPSIIATHLTEVIKSHLDELITRQEVKNLINKVAEDNQTLIDELVPKLLTVGEIQKVLTNLLAEGVSIRDLVTIFETLADQALVTKDIDVLTEYARQSQKRSISNKFLEEQNQQVLTLDPAVESMIMESVKHSEQGTYLTLDPEVISEIVAVTDKAVRKLTDMGRMPIIITSPILRIYYKRIIQEQLPEVVVISYNEIDASTELQSVGMVSLS